MRDLTVRRIRRVVSSLAEPSGWRSMRLVLGIGRKNKPVEPPRPGSVDKITPEPRRSHEGIPPIVFQTWKSREKIPANFRYWRQTFVDHNPEAQVILWDDDDNREFIAQNFAWFLPTYNSFPREIFRADAVRYLFLFSFGGLYADMDSECLRPLRLEQRKEAVILGRMGSDTGFEHSVPNALMASRPGQAFWLLVVQRMFEALDNHEDAESQSKAGPEELTGPILLKRSYDEYCSLSQQDLLAADRARLAAIGRPAEGVGRMWHDNLARPECLVSPRLDQPVPQAAARPHRSRYPAAVARHRALDLPPRRTGHILEPFLVTRETVRQQDTASAPRPHSIAGERTMRLEPAL